MPGLTLGHTQTKTPARSERTQDGAGAEGRAAIPAPSPQQAETQRPWIFHPAEAPGKHLLCQRLSGLASALLCEYLDGTGWALLTCEIYFLSP